MLMEESTTYQGIIGKGRVEGRVEGKRSLLFRLGAKRFGIAESATLEAIQRITDAEKLDQLAERILDAVSWDDLLAVS